MFPNDVSAILLRIFSKSNHYYPKTMCYKYVAELTLE